MLDDNQQEAITKLMAGQDKKSICKDLGICRTTIYNWLDTTEFQKEFKERQKEVIQTGNNFIIAKTNQYLKEMDNLAMNSTDARTKLTALTFMLERSMGKTANRVEVETTQSDNAPTLEDLKKELNMIEATVVEGSERDIG